MALTKKEIAVFKNKLEDLRTKLIGSLKESTEEVKTPDDTKGYSQHQADEGTDDFDKTISIELTNKEFDELQRINRALEKIEENTYGICDISGEKIPHARLEAIPYATMTVSAQEQYEAQLKQSRH